MLIKIVYVSKEVSRKIRKYFKQIENENMIYQNLWDSAKYCSDENI